MTCGYCEGTFVNHYKHTYSFTKFKHGVVAYSDEGRGDGDDVTKLGQLSGIKRSFLNHEVPVSWGKRVRATIPFAYLFLYIQYNPFFFCSSSFFFPLFCLAMMMMTMMTMMLI